MYRFQEIHFFLIIMFVIRAAVEGKTKGISFRNYKEMFQKMEETFKFCTGCNKLPEHLSEGHSLKRCVKWVQSPLVRSNAYALHRPLFNAA